MVTFDQVYDYIEKASPEDIYTLFFTALANKKVNFVNLSKAYVSYLQYKEDDTLNKLVEAETCVMESLIYDKIDKRKPNNKKSIQRRLYLLNKSGRINASPFNEKWEYEGDEKAKELSWYERNKE